MPDTCPTCGAEVTLAALENKRNGRWTVLPLEDAQDPELEANFVLRGERHEAVDILGTVVGEFPVAEYVELSTEHQYRTHHPSHYLEAH